MNRYRVLMAAEANLEVTVSAESREDAELAAFDRLDQLRRPRWSVTGDPDTVAVSVRDHGEWRIAGDDE